ncbi:MAG: universal stress protein [Bryobacteraceae bacterium]|jgi:nucleotide-binding universal stress UspA family protein
MVPLAKILLPVDFSERSVGAVHCAQRLAQRFSPEIILLHVLAPMHYRLGDTEMGGVMLGDLYRAQIESLTLELEQFQQVELAGCNVRRVVVDGDPAFRIVEFAHDEKVCLIMMPTHGCGLFRRYILGSNTAKVLHDAECPVWTGVHIAETAAKPVEIRHVLCAVDLGPQSERALKWAHWLSRTLEARLTLLHVTAAVPETPDHTDDAWRAKLRWSAEETLGRLQAKVGSQAEVMLQAGDPAHAICAAAARIHAGALVIARGSAAGGFGRLRTNAYAIIRQSPCPVVSV